jgi:flavin-dependent dehydrogenase
MSQFLAVKGSWLHILQKLADNGYLTQHCINEVVPFLHQDEHKIQHEVIVIGGGLAGMAAAIHLTRAGLQVVCLDGDPPVTDPVGESLDWSAPDLLAAIGLPADELVRRGIATAKRHVILKLRDGSERHYVPGEWLGKPPFNVRLDTIHVDRTELGKAVRQIVDSLAIPVIADRVMGVERDGGRVASVTTKQGLTLRAKWFIDASGSSGRLFAKTFQLPSSDYGPPKVAMWDYFTTTNLVEGTTLYGSAAPGGYMDWIWQIPVRTGLVSVGCVETGEGAKRKRQSGLEVEQIYNSRLEEFSAFERLRKQRDSGPNVTSFRCRVHARVAGANWLIAGEAASMVDPMTSNGVTAALRHASEAAKLIIESRHRSRLPRLGTTAYAWRVRDVAAFFNSLIERVIYEPPIRGRVGALLAGDIYTIPAWLMNLFYARLQPEGVLASAAFGMALRLLRWSANTFSWLCRSTSSHSLRTSRELPAQG